MNDKYIKKLQMIIQPFMLVLQEGNEIKQDFLDYDLLMLRMSCNETLPSPKGFVEITQKPKEPKVIIRKRPAITVHNLPE